MRRFRGGTIVFAVVVLTFLSTTPALAKERVAIACGPHASRVHPWRCFVTGYEGGGSLASVYLVHLRWSNWGGHAARAHGYIVDSETGTRSATKIRVSGRQQCGGKPFYRRLRLGYMGHTLVRLRAIACPS
jgi:hypothetical protein